MRLLVLLALLALSLPAHALPLAQAPAVRVQDAQRWYGDALWSGVYTQADACDDGVVRADMRVEGYATRAAGPAPGCVVVPYWIPPDRVVAPGAHRAVATATDDQGLAGADVGIVRLPLVPDSPARHGRGFPDLARSPAPALGDLVEIDLVLAPGSAARAYALRWNGSTWADTTWAVAPQPGDWRLTLVFHAGAGEAAAYQNGTARWVGHARAAGPEWWQVAPLADTGNPVVLT